MSRFSNPQAVIAAADDTIACLAADDDSKSCLYAHPVMLSTWSGTLRHALEVAGGKGTSTEATKGTCNSSESSSYKLITIPVEASEVAAWEAALNVMHPPLAAAATSQITADNAMSLLQLADKYDMPSVTGNLCCPSWGINPAICHCRPMHMAWHNMAWHMHHWDEHSIEHASLCCGLVGTHQQLFWSVKLWTVRLHKDACKWCCPC
jgi:hypothetical protein